MRARILSRDKYLDQELKRVGKLKPAEVVHHILPREDFPEYEWKEWNLISLTKKTHNAMHDRTTNALTARGKELMRRTARKNNIEIPEEIKTESKKLLNWNWRR